MVRFPIFAAVMAGKITALEAVLKSDLDTMSEQESNALVRAAKLEQGEAPVSTLSFLMEQASKLGARKFTLNNEGGFMTA